MRALRFYLRSVASGWKLLNGVLSGVLTFVGFLGLCGIVIVARVNHWPSWVLVSALCLAVLITFGAGAYRVWDETDRTLTARTEAPPIAAPADPRPDGSEPFQAPGDAELEVILDREEIHPFQWKANIVELKVTVRNRTGKTKHIAGPFEWMIDGPINWDGVHDADVTRERYAREQRRQSLVGELGPYEVITGWVATVLPHQPEGGVGGFTFTIEDELGTRYFLRRERRGGRLPHDSPAAQTAGPAE